MGTVDGVKQYIELRKKSTCCQLAARGVGAAAMLPIRTGIWLLAGGVA